MDADSLLDIAQGRAPEVSTDGIDDLLTSSTTSDSNVSVKSGFEDEPAAEPAAEEDEGLEAAESTEEDSTGEEAMDENPVADGKKSRAQERIRQLANRAKEAESRAEQMAAQQQQQFQQMQWQMQQQYQAQVQGLQQQLDLQRQQADEFRKVREFEENKNLSAGEKLEREWLNKASSEAERKLSSKFESKLSQLEQQLAQEQQYRAQQVQQMEQQKRYQYFTGEANSAVKNEILKGFDAKDTEKLAGRGQDLYLTYWTAFGTDPKTGQPRNKSEVAREFKDYLDQYADARNRTISKVGGAKIKQSQAAPQPLTGAKAGAAKGGSYWPSEKELRTAGYDNYVKWLGAGKPNLTQNRKSS